MPSEEDVDAAAAVTADRLTAMLVQVDQVVLYDQEPFDEHSLLPFGLRGDSRATWFRRWREWREAKRRLGEL